MTTATIKLSAAVYFAAGESINGRALTEAQWVRSGVVEVSADRAETLARDGYADIVSMGGVLCSKVACCTHATAANAAPA